MWYSIIAVFIVQVHLPIQQEVNENVYQNFYFLWASLKTRLIKEKTDRYDSCKETFHRRAAALKVRSMNCLIFDMGCKKQNKSVILILRLYCGTCNTLKFMV